MSHTSGYYSTNNVLHHKGIHVIHKKLKDFSWSISKVERKIIQFDCYVFLSLVTKFKKLMQTINISAEKAKQIIVCLNFEAIYNVIFSMEHINLFSVAAIFKKVIYKMLQDTVMQQFNLCCCNLPQKVRGNGRNDISNIEISAVYSCDINLMIHKILLANAKYSLKDKTQVQYLQVLFLKFHS